MEDHKLQALHDSLSKLRGHKGLGTSSQYSWQKTVAQEDGDRQKKYGLPNNTLYSYFVPEGTYDPKKKASDGDGRFIKRDFGSASSSSSEDDESSFDTAERKRRRKEKRKAEKKAADAKEKKADAKKDSTNKEEAKKSADKEEAKEDEHEEKFLIPRPITLCG